jgi:hypothetical protein
MAACRSGGLLGVALAVYLFSRVKRINPLSLGDIASAATPFGLFFGRLANFINSEVVGRASDVPWAMVFPGADDVPRHPSQLYEAFLEGLVLFVILRIATHRYHALTRPGTVFGLFLVFYGIFRTSRFVRSPRRSPARRQHPHARRRLFHPMVLRRMADLAGEAAAGLGIIVMGAQPKLQATPCTPLAAMLRERIARDGPISVHDYMEACLADGRAGYYATRQPIGREGDFVTAPEISQIFGELIGVWAAAIWQAMSEPASVIVAELGPGRGTLMADALRAFRSVPSSSTASP